MTEIKGGAGSMVDDGMYYCVLLVRPSVHRFVKISSPSTKRDSLNTVSLVTSRFKSTSFSSCSMSSTVSCLLIDRKSVV